VTTCYIGHANHATEIWAADTLRRTAKFDVDYHIFPQFEVQGQKRIISYFNSEITTLDLSTGQVQSTPLKLDGDLEWVSPEAKYAITHSSNTTAYQVRDLATQRILNTFWSVGVVEKLQVSRDGRLLFSQQAAGNVTIRVRDVQTMQPLQPLLDIIGDPYSGFRVSPNGRLLAVLTDYKVTIIDLQAKSVLETIPVENSGQSILFSPDGTTIALPASASNSDSNIDSDIIFQPVDVVVFGTGLPSAPAQPSALTSAPTTGAETTTPAASAPANSPSAELLSITQTADCAWDVRISLSGFAPNSAITVSSSYTEVECASRRTVTDTWMYLSSYTESIPRGVFSADWVAIAGIGQSLT
jgi:hypothetical protein